MSLPLTAERRQSQPNVLLAEWLRGVAVRALADGFRSLEEQQERLRACLRATDFETPINPDCVEVWGEFSNRTIYVFGETATLVVTPFADVDSCVALKGLRTAVIQTLDSNACIVSPDHELRARLAGPRILLVNPTNPTFDHVPSPALGIGMIAGVLRRHQLARVRLLDFKLGDTLNLFKRELSTFSPNLIGVSIDFGELDLAREILHLARAPEVATKPIIFAGNYLARIYSKALLAEFSELLINHGEGEAFIIDLVHYWAGQVKREQISALTFLDPENGQVRMTRLREFDMEDTTLPAPDLFQRFADGRAALSLELSRGCSYNACTFCPRTHKIRKWKALPPRDAVDRIVEVARFFDANPRLRRRIYLVDEEFIGYSSSVDPTARLQEFADRLLASDVRVSFEFNTRVDQILDPGRDKAWHLARWGALLACRRSGLSRILLGVESGSNGALQRFLKGHTVEQSILALRVLSALGIDIRVTFITYDPLQTAPELAENFVFLGRRDALVTAHVQDEAGIADLFGKLEDPKYIACSRSGAAIFEKVTYLHNTMKVLPDSRYAKQLVQDSELSRVTTAYRDHRIGVIADLGEAWMDNANRLTMLLARDPPCEAPDRRKFRRSLLKGLESASYAYLGFLLVALTDEKVDFSTSMAGLRSLGFEPGQVPREASAVRNLGHRILQHFAHLFLTSPAAGASEGCSSLAREIDNFLASLPHFRAASPFQ